MKTNVVALIGVLLLSSCINVKGTFTAHEDLKLKTKKLFSSKLKNVKLKAGTYSTVMEPNKSKIHFNFKSDGKTIKVKIPRPDKHIPANGQVVFTASETKQNYDFLVDLKTDYRTAGPFHTTESCSYTIYERRCERVCTEVKDRDRRDRGNRGDRRRRCERVCKRVPVTHYGRQDVTYHVNYTDRDFILELKKPSTGELVGEFRGDHTESNRITDYEGPCIGRHLHRTHIHIH